MLAIQNEIEALQRPTQVGKNPMEKPAVEQLFLSLNQHVLFQSLHIRVVFAIFTIL